MSLPALIPVPPVNLQKQIDPSEWTSFISAWSILTRAYTTLPETEFQKQVLRPELRVEEFLLSFVKNAPNIGNRLTETDTQRSLKQSCLALIARLSQLELGKQSRIITPSFIEDLCLLYFETPGVGDIVDRLWKRCQETSKAASLAWKQSIIVSLMPSIQKVGSKTQGSLARLAVCVKVSPGIGSFLMEGSDFLDACVSAWRGMDSKDSRKVTVIMFYCLAALLENEPKNTSLLWDHLYTLKTDHAECQSQGKTSLLEELLGTTPLLTRLMKEDSTDHGRGQTILQDMQNILGSSAYQHHTNSKSHNKGKGRATPEDNDEMHMHRMSLVSQVQELFPALEISHILRYLDEFNDDPERVIAHLLDNPPSPPLAHTNTLAETQPLPTVSEALTKLPPHPPYTSQLPIRKNIYDDEDLANLDPSRLHKGHKPDTQPLQTPSTSAKAALLSALAAFDSDSDERDDTYDIDDVGGTIEPTIAGDDDETPNDEVLYLAWKSTPDLFARDTTTRRSKARITLREKTGLTDEALEGWALMLTRNPRQQRSLERRFAMHSVQQTELQTSSWKASELDTDENGESQRHVTDRGRGGRIRGQGRGRGRGRGAPRNAEGEGSAAGTANERRKKDANKSSRANHNRRDQRAKKISRAGFPG